jgi:hypothetical protein
MIEKKLETYDKLFTRIRQANYITRIIDSKEEKLEFDIYHKTLYTFILQRFNSNLKLNKPTRLSIDYLAAECAFSSSSVDRKIKELKNFGIIEYITSRSKTGVFTTSTYTKVINLIDTNLYRLHGESIKTYWGKINDKREFVESMKHDNVDKTGWTKQESSYYWQNKNYQMLTGTYLSGDMKSGLLYKNDVKFRWENELREFELDFLNKEDN